MNLITQKKQKPILIYTKQAIYSTWIEINKKALTHNIAQYKKIIGHSALAAVIKSNAYGHGIEQIAQLCEHNSSVDYLCTVSLTEALRIRSYGIKKPILVLSIIDESLEKAVENSIDLVVYDMHLARELNALAKQYTKKAAIHIKVDTGLSRLGFLADSAYEPIKQIYQLPCISIKGIFTHFAESENADQTFTNFQKEKFDTLVQQLETAGITIPLKHTACSAAITANLESHYTMVRIGIGLYGLWSSDDNKKITQELYPGFSLQPVLTWKTKIIQIKEVPAGSYIGYDRTYQTKKVTRLATLPVGYWDGYDRELSNRGIVMINNQYAPVVGRVAMNLTMIDITDLDVSIHDEVLLLGNQEKITAHDIAQLCTTINYEIITKINPLLPRILSE